MESPILIFDKTLDLKPILIDKSLPKIQFYEKLYEIANAQGLKASEYVQPTPMVFTNGYVMQNGPCGFAWVVLPDGRKSFARWITKNGLGELVGRQGVWIDAKVNTENLDLTAKQSLIRKEAYAFLFAKVLKATGIDCYPHSHIN